MRESYVKIGGDPALFSDLTPRLYLIDMLGYYQRERASGRGSTSQAWLTAVLSRAGKVPPLSELLDGRPTLTAEQAVAHLRALAGGRMNDD